MRYVWFAGEDLRYCITREFILFCLGAGFEPSLETDFAVAGEYYYPDNGHWGFRGELVRGWI
jgi:hypothetical protein